MKFTPVSVKRANNLPSLTLRTIEVIPVLDLLISLELVMFSSATKKYGILFNIKEY